MALIPIRVQSSGSVTENTCVNRRSSVDVSPFEQQVSDFDEQVLLAC